MKVRDLMRSHARTCGVDDDLVTVGRLMGEVGCGVLPVVAGDVVLGMITDRDVCLALTREDLRPSEVKVSDVAHGGVVTCRPNDELSSALETMGRHRIRRLPVVDAEERLVGLVSLDDAVAESQGGDLAAVLRALQAINRHEVPAAL